MPTFSFRNCPQSSLLDIKAPREKMIYFVTFRLILFSMFLLNQDCFTPLQRHWSFWGHQWPPCCCRQCQTQSSVEWTHQHHLIQASLSLPWKAFLKCLPWPLALCSFPPSLTGCFSPGSFVSFPYLHNLETLRWSSLSLWIFILSYLHVLPPGSQLAWWLETLPVCR